MEGAAERVLFAGAVVASLLPEEGYPGEVDLLPVDDFPLVGAMFSDGSVALEGGAAAVEPVEGAVRTAKVLGPRSSTHCELIALALALEQAPTQVLSDSLAALTMFRNRGCWPQRRLLASGDRVQVRYVLHWSPPLLWER